MLEPRKSVVGKPPRRAAMEMITLPGTTLRASRICLGTQQFPDKEREEHSEMDAEHGS